MPNGRHRWDKVDEDMRRYIDEPRPVLHRCSRCGVYRMMFNFGGSWRTYYGEPYRAGRARPECKKGS